MTSHSHFQDKDALGHIVEKQLEGILTQSEPHGAETPGHLAAGADALRETALFLLLFWTASLPFNLSAKALLLSLLALGIGWMTWKAARSGWLGFQRLERLHRVMEQEQWEIEHHRDQERLELRELYRAKGFEGKLLEDVVDVLMADGDRLLKVMLEEELGFSLEAEEHPLKQALGAGVGALIALGFSLFTIVFFPVLFPAVAIGLMGLAGFASAYYDRNALIPSIIWNMGIGGTVFGIVYFLFKAWS